MPNESSLKKDQSLRGDPRRGFSDVVQDILADLQRLVRSELQLAKVEVRQDVMRALAAGVWLGMGTVAGLAAAMLLVWVAVFGLATRLPMWGATLAVSGVVTVVAVVLLMVGRRRLQLLQLTPERAVDSVKEDVAWIKQSIR